MRKKLITAITIFAFLFILPLLQMTLAQSYGSPTPSVTPSTLPETALNGSDFGWVDLGFIVLIISTCYLIFSFTQTYRNIVQKLKQ